jgi:hypothetical protein
MPRSKPTGRLIVSRDLNSCANGIKESGNGLPLLHWLFSKRRVESGGKLKAGSIQWGPELPGRNLLALSRPTLAATSQAGSKNRSTRNLSPQRPGSRASDQTNTNGSAIGAAPISTQDTNSSGEMSGRRRHGASRSCQQEKVAAQKRRPRHPPFCTAPFTFLPGLVGVDRLTRETKMGDTGSGLFLRTGDKHRKITEYHTYS